jgi:hypothetical protein
MSGNTLFMKTALFTLFMLTMVNLLIAGAALMLSPLCRAEKTRPVYVDARLGTSGSNELVSSR